MDQKHINSPFCWCQPVSITVHSAEPETILIHDDQNTHGRTVAEVLRNWFGIELAPSSFDNWIIGQGGFS